jgi:hypothetical protein
LPAPVAFLRECVSPCSFRLAARLISRCMSAGAVGSIGMTFSGV